MSQADIVLDTLSADGGVIYTAGSAAEEYIIIDRYRNINVPTSLKKIAIEHDHNVETVTFECPRYWDDHDLSTMNIYINYLLPDGTPDSYPVNNVSAIGEVIYFTWTISNRVTRVKGNLKFNVCAKLTDDDGFEEVHWNSELNRDMYINEGLETTESALSSQPDVVTQLLSRMSEVEKTAMKKEELETITKIRKDVSKYLVQVNDVSQAAHDTNVEIAATSKNILFPTISGSSPTNGFRSTSNADGTISVTGSASAAIDFYLYLHTSKGPYILKKDKQYVLSIYKDGKILDVSTHPKLRVNIQTELLSDASSLNVPHAPKNGRFEHVSVYTRSGDAAIQHVALAVKKDDIVVGDTTLCGTYAIQIEEGTTSTRYTPHANATGTNITVCDRNLVNLPDITLTKTTAWAYEEVGKFDLPPGTYIMTAYYNQRDYRAYASIGARHYSDSTIMYAETKSSSTSSGYIRMEFTIPEDDFGVSIWLCSNASDTALSTRCIFEDMSISTLEEGYELNASNHEPYNGATYTFDENGKISIKRESPLMTVYSEREGVIVNVNYIRDTATVVNEIHSKIDSLLERVERLEST